MIPSIHNPQTSSTPSERLFAERRRQRQARMDRVARMFDAMPPKPPCTRPYRPTQDVVIVNVPEPIEQWTERQRRLHPVVKFTSARPSFEAIQRATVAQFPDVTYGDILGRCRTKEIVRPRQIAMYLAKELTRRSLPEIGRGFRGLDHTTVLHAVRKIGGLIKTDADTAALVGRIMSSLTTVQA